jgi:hypothetical protein
MPFVIGGFMQYITARVFQLKINHFKYRYFIQSAKQLVSQLVYNNAGKC